MEPGRVNIGKLGRRTLGQIAHRIERDHPMALLIADAAKIAISQNPEQPSLGSLGFAKLRKPCQGFAERFLGQVLGIGRGTGEPVSVAVEPLVVGVDQFVEPAARGHRAVLNSSEPANGVLFPRTFQRTIRVPSSFHTGIHFLHRVLRCFPANFPICHFFRE